MFVGREDIIANIYEGHEQVASQSHSRVALVGLGGVGKSQIAIEYAYRVRESKPQIWVFWIHASNAVRFEQAYRNIAVKVEIPGRDDPKANVVRLVYDWLCDEKSGQWLMILDNADDQGVFLYSGSDFLTTGQVNSESSRKAPLVSVGLPPKPVARSVV
ncbi:hypothetical protein MMC29_006468 [Sticta canariensis]|nr:hypothetical protein [Sticta canariensis]